MPIHRHYNLPPAVDVRDPEIADAMICKHDLQAPGPEEFKGYIAEDEISDLAKRDRKTILAMSVIEQWNDWQTGAIIETHRLLRQLDAEVAKRKIESAKIKAQQEKQGWVWAIVKWTLTIGAAGFAGALFRWLFEKGG